MIYITTSSSTPKFQRFSHVAGLARGIDAVGDGEWRMDSWRLTGATAGNR